MLNAMVALEELVMLMDHVATSMGWLAEEHLEGRAHGARQEWEVQCQRMALGFARINERGS